jgi:hypothetical protein
MIVFRRNKNGNNPQGILTPSWYSSSTAHGKIGTIKKTPHACEEQKKELAVSAILRSAKRITPIFPRRESNICADMPQSYQNLGWFRNPQSKSGMCPTSKYQKLVLRAIDCALCTATQLQGTLGDLISTGIFRLRSNGTIPIVQFGIGRCACRGGSGPWWNGARLANTKGAF